jgi:uncharacterized protein YjiS (DUF1127 family)
MLLCSECALKRRWARLFSFRKIRKQRRNCDRVTTMNLIRNYRNWRRYRQTVNELNRLSNRELNDLGITRGDIPFVARRSL